MKLANAIPSISLFLHLPAFWMYSKALLDNYEADESLPEKPSAAELHEEDDFINALAVSEGPMKIGFQYLKDKGKISMKVKALWSGSYPLFEPAVLISSYPR